MAFYLHPLIDQNFILYMFNTLHNTMRQDNGNRIRFVSAACSFSVLICCRFVSDIKRLSEKYKKNSPLSLWEMVKVNTVQLVATDLFTGRCRNDKWSPIHRAFRRRRFRPGVLRRVREAAKYGCQPGSPGSSCLHEPRQRG
jgi:hypothetical protein